MRIETVDIIRDLVAQLRVKVIVRSVTDNLDGTFTITTCDTKHINIGLTFTIASVVYTVVSFVKDTSFIVSGASTISVSSFFLDAPKFWHGSILETNKNLVGIMNMEEKVPMVFLRRPYRDTFFNRNETNDRESDCTIYFLTEDLFDQYDIDERDKECIEPMRSMLYSFVELLKDNYQIGVIESFQVENKEKFGVVPSKGTEKVLFDTPLSGCELSLSIPVMRNYKCKC